QQDDDLPIVPVSQARGVPEEHREREQRRDDPEDRAEHARRKVGAVLQLFGDVDAPEGRKNAECGMRNECHGRFRASELASPVDLALQFRIPHSAFRIGQPPTAPYFIRPRVHATRYAAIHTPSHTTCPTNPRTTAAPCTAPVSRSTGKASI